MIARTHMSAVDIRHMPSATSDQNIHCRSPLRNRAIGVTPDRVAPAVSQLGCHADLSLIKLDAQPRASQPWDMAILIVKDIRVDQVVQQIRTLVVVDAQ